MADAPKTNGNDRFKLPGSSLDEVFKVVQGYASFGKTASLTDIAKNTGMHATSISKNVGFLSCSFVKIFARRDDPTPFTAQGIDDVCGAHGWGQSLQTTVDHTLMRGLGTA